MFNFLWCFFISLLLLEYAWAKTDEEVKAEFIHHVMACAAKNPVDMQEIMKLHKLEVPTKRETKCLLACAYKAHGSMNAKGMYDLEKGYKMAEENKNGDEKRFENGKKLADTCNKVNSMEVTDGENGCDRAAFMFQCVVDNAPKFGFKV